MKKIFVAVFLLTIICVLITIFILFDEISNPSTVNQPDENISTKETYYEFCKNMAIEENKSVNDIRDYDVDTSEEKERELDYSTNKCISVLLKNKKSIYFDNIMINGDLGLIINDNNIGNTFDVKRYVWNEAPSVEIYSEGKMIFNNKSYEGCLIVKPYKEGYVVINKLPIETYVKYVIPSEMPASFSQEAKKAQAICARTLAYYQLRINKEANNEYIKLSADLDDSTMYQVFNNAGRNEDSDSAVDDTMGKIITYKKEPISCYYFSTSAGTTEKMNIWGSKSLPYIKQVESNDINSPYYRWDASLNLSLISNNKYGKLLELEINKKSENGTVISLLARYENGDIIYKYENVIRSIISKAVVKIQLYNGLCMDDIKMVPSANFTIENVDEGTIILHGAGFGHGIGMSQYGADALAKAGYSFDQIINYYYKDVEIKDISDIY